jgi:hypothetical protein
MPSGTATIDFGAFPGKSDASLAITGQASIVSGSLVEAWIRPEATADHSADEHMVETIKVFAGNIVAGTGFTIYAFNTNQINESPLGATYLTGSINGKIGDAPTIYGTWKVAWVWN